MTGREFIEKLCEITIGVTNMKLLARETGVSSNIFSCIKNGQQKCKFRSEHAKTIVKRYPNVSLLWLIDPETNTEAEIQQQVIEGGITPFARIEAIARHYCLTIPQLNKQLGLSDNMLYNLKTKVKNISVPLFRTIITHYPNINPAWLTSGTGEMFLPIQPQNKPFTTPISDVQSGSAAHIPSQVNGGIAATYIANDTSIIAEAAALATTIREERIRLQDIVNQAQSIVNDLKDTLKDVHSTVTTTRYTTSFVAEDITQ